MSRSLFIVIYYASCNKIDYFIQNQFFKLAENIRTHSQLLPTFFCHLLTILGISVSVLILYFNWISGTQLNITFLGISLLYSLSNFITEITIIKFVYTFIRKFVQILGSDLSAYLSDEYTNLVQITYWIRSRNHPILESQAKKFLPFFCSKTNRVQPTDEDLSKSAYRMKDLDGSKMGPKSKSLNTEEHLEILDQIWKTIKDR